MACALACLAACGGPGDRWVVMNPTAAGGGIEARILQSRVADQGVPYQPPAGRHCVVYVITVRSTDGRRHELRAEDFRTADGGDVLAAIGPCGAPQIDPTWIDPSPRRLELTLLAQSPEPLAIRLPGG